MKPDSTAAAPVAASRAVLLLLFGSGLCALVYQVAWLRLLRLVFGASTAASAAVLAIFMAGLGLGSLWLGRRVEGLARPMRFYAGLEVGIALAAAASPLLVLGVRWLYLELGGTAALGVLPGTLLRLLLSAAVLGLPTFLMGGTLPAMARAVESSADAGRRRVALLIGANTFGAVCGALVTTFVAIEWLGVQRTVWAASALNLLVAAGAWALAARTPPVAVRAGDPRAGETRSGEARLGPAGPLAFLLAAAAAVGFAFLLMELVWYRMLAPVLGGSSYTFGLILAVALLGMGAGGVLYGLGPRKRRPTLSLLAGTCAAEALALAVPYALGDRVAVVAMLLQPIGDVSFSLLVGAWGALTAVVVLPAAIVAGYQFPVLIALLGAGDREVGREVGLTYAWNTAGTIAGSIAGGFGLLPLLSATGAWATATFLLAALAAAAWALDRRRAAEPGPAVRRPLWPLAAGTAALALLALPGPGAVWRHTAAGAGSMPSSFADRNEIVRMSRAVRRAIVWERDGRESSVAVHGLDEVSMMLNGRADGSALRDAPTQVMSGLVGAVLHPDPRRALVIGLGTGSSAGWLAEVESIEHVDVVELEPATLEIARRCAPVNHDALDHPEIDLWIGDGREFMLTADESYDVIFSEPSNPHRAGISSLFTEEFYRAAAARLGADGIFLQWLQSYHVDSGVVRTVLATLATVFDNVESWQVHSGDLLLVASRRPIDHDLARIELRTRREPVASALRYTFGVEGAEGFYSGFLASAAFAREVRRQQDGLLNTDDRPRIEFGFARSLGRNLEFDPQRLTNLAAARGEHLPPLHGGRIDWRRVLDLRSARNAKWGATTSYPETGDAGFDHRVGARNAYVLGDLVAAGRRWSSQSQAPESPFDRLLVAEALAAQADPRALAAAAELAAEERPVEASAVRARFLYGSGRLEEAAAELVGAFETARRHPWAHRPTLERALQLASILVRDRKELGHRLFEALAEPFAVSLLDEARLLTRLDLAGSTSFESLCRAALEPFEPATPWDEAFLEQRRRCYLLTSHPTAARALAELESYRRNAPPALDGD